MKLGQWIEFDAVIVREATAQGSQVRTQPLANPKRGMIIGIRPVYDARGNFPPTLSNRRDVLLVATSLHTCYRVFPGDATLAAGVDVAQAAAQATFVAAADDSEDDLAPVTDAELQMWVIDAINAQIAARCWFTAYDITLAVRDDHPQDDIRHAEVRAIVHQCMQHVITSGLYEPEQAQFGSDSAIRYVPL